MLSQQSFWATSARRPKCLHRWLLFLVLLCAGEQITLIWRIPASKSESNQKPIIKVNWIKLIQHDTTIPDVDLSYLFLPEVFLVGGALSLAISSWIMPIWYMWKVSSSQSCVEISTGSSNSWEPKHRSFTEWQGKSESLTSHCHLLEKFQPVYACSIYKQDIRYHKYRCIHLIIIYYYIISVHLINIYIYTLHMV